MADRYPLGSPFQENRLMPKTESQNAKLITDAQIEHLCETLGHVFKEPLLLRAALTHPSLGGMKSQKKGGNSSPYERLEFLGDRVLGLVMAEWLYALFPDAKEGDLAKRHAALVNRDALRAVAHEIALERYLRLAHGEVPEVAHKNMAVLPDAMEAVIGALYLDAGLEAAGAFIRKYWGEAINAPASPPIDAKTALQEWAQGRGFPLPVYTVLDRSGPAHAPRFVLEVSVKGFEPVKAEGPSKRLAEKRAAALLLVEVQKKAEKKD
jgi:ribonuclease-3